MDNEQVTSIYMLRPRSGEAAWLDDLSCMQPHDMCILTEFNNQEAHFSAPALLPYPKVNLKRKQEMC
jgi:hypothetical protein